MPTEPRSNVIDAIRGIAVAAVVLYHLEISVFSWGYIGVDAFFVLSGYLIGGQLFRLLVKGQYDAFGSFWRRRLVRLLPASFLVISCTCVLIPFLLVPGKVVDSSQTSAVWAALGAINFKFWLAGESYFQSAATLNPFLHFWSLAVEWQFYALSSVGFLVLASLKKRRLLILPIHIAMLVAAAVVIAVSIAVFVTEGRPAAAFYLMPARLYEFGLGALVAVSRGSGAQQPLLIGAATVALGWVYLLLASFDLSSPYILGAPVTILVCIILLSEASIRRVSQLTGVMAIAAFWGRRSYSIYLVHWPVIVFAMAADPDGQLSWTVCVSLIFGILLVSELVYRVADRPVQRARSSHLLQLISFAALAGALAAALPLRDLARTAHWDRHGAWRERLDAEFDGLVGCLGRPYSDLCSFGDPKSSSRIVIWGDSHAAQYHGVLSELSEELSARVSIVSEAACPPILNYKPLWFDFNGPRCNQYNQQFIGYLRDESEYGRLILVMAARWLLHVPSPGVGAVEREQFLEELRVVGPLPASALVEQIHRTLQVLEAEVDEIRLLGPQPEHVLSVPECYVRFGVERCFRPRLDVEKEVAEITRELRRRLNDVDYAHFVDPISALCTSKLCPGMDPSPLYLDDDHLSYRGAMRVLDGTDMFGLRSWSTMVFTDPL